MDKRRASAITLGAAVGGAAVALYHRYRRDRRRALARLRFGSRVAATARGPVEYDVAGDGPAVLIAHGLAGGYDQGLYLARPFTGSGFRFIAPSRPGYLQTPLASGYTPREQAELYAALLDTLNISRAAIIGVSTGGPSALQFALRFPDRCWGVVLISAFSRQHPLSPLQLAVAERLVRYDVIGWLLTSLGEELCLALCGVRGSVRAAIRRDWEKMSVLRGILHGAATTSARRSGTLNDLWRIASLPAYPLECIQTPTLAIHSPTDPFAPYAHARFVSERVPGARLLSLPDGGHFCLLTHMEHTVPEIVAFLRQHAPRSVRQALSEQLSAVDKRP